MTHKQRLTAAMIVLLSAGCGLPTLEQEANLAGLRPDGSRPAPPPRGGPQVPPPPPPGYPVPPGNPQPQPPRPDRPGFPSRPTPTPSAHPAPEPDVEPPPPAGQPEPIPEGLEIRAYAHGMARLGNARQWSFAMSIGYEADKTPKGTFLIVSSIDNVTLFGTVTGGTVSRNAGGGGIATFTGVCTTGQSITITATDQNSPTVQDRFNFTVTGGPNFAGAVYNGDVRLLRARPERRGRSQPSGYQFESRIGLYILQQDLLDERKPPDEKVHIQAIELVHPEPVIDFREDDEGGYLNSPGSADNVPR